MASLSLDNHSADAYWEMVYWYSFQSAVAVGTCLAAYISLSSHLHKYVSQGDVSYYILGDVMPIEKRFPFQELTTVVKPSAENKDAGEAKVEEDDEDDDEVGVDHVEDDDDDSSDGEDDDEDDSDAQGSDNEDSDEDEDDDDDDDDDDDGSDDDEDDDGDEDEEEEEEEESNQPPYKMKK